MTVIFRERTGLYWLAGPGADLIDAISDIEDTHRAFL